MNLLFKVCLFNDFLKFKKKYIYFKYIQIKFYRKINKNNFYFIKSYLFLILFKNNFFKI